MPDILYQASLTLKYGACALNYICLNTKRASSVRSMNLLRSLAISILLLGLCVIAYWDIAFFNDTLKWDMLDCYYPWRQFVAECVQFRVFPFWNPYQDMGYPIYADMRSVFYPEPWLIGLFGGYSMKVFHGIFLFYLVMAGVGMYQLAGHFAQNNWARIVVASAYVLSGFFVGHGQELAGIIGATWIPWTLLYFLRFQQSLRFANLFKLALFLFLLLTGGYQAINIIYIYLLLLLGMASLAGRWSEDGTKQVLLNALLGLLVICSIAMLALTYTDVSPHVGRLTGLTLQEAHVGYVAPHMLASFIAPYAATAKEGLESTDGTMQNMYVGLIVLLFFFIGLFVRKSTELKIILGFGLVCLLASLGPFTPVREWLFNILPGMNLFRMSSFFSYFSQLAVLLVASVGLEHFLRKPQASWTLFKRSWLFVLLLTVTVSWVGYAAWPTLSLQVLGNLFDWSALEGEMKFGQRLMVHGCYQLAFVLALGGLLFALKERKTLLGGLVLLLVMLEMVVSVRLNFQTTVGGGYQPSEIQAKLDAQAKGFPIPDNELALRWNSDSKPELLPLYHNTNILTKTVSWDGFNSFKLRNFESFKDERPEAFAQAMSKPLLYGMKPETAIRITDFGPNGVNCSVVANGPDSITLQQTYFPGWEATVNGSLATASLVDGVFQRVAVPEGISTLQFEYRNPRVKNAVLFSYGIVAILILLVVFFSLGEAGLSHVRAGVAALVFGALAAGVLAFQWSNTASNHAFKVGNYELLALSAASLSGSSDAIVLQVDDRALMDSVLKANGIANKVVVVSNPGGPELNELLRMPTDSGAKLIYAAWNQPESDAVKELLRTRFGYLHKMSSDAGFIYRSDARFADAPHFETRLSFEEDNALWNFQVARSDSSVDAFSGTQRWKIGVDEMGSPPLILRVGDVATRGHYELVFGTSAQIPSGNGGMANMYVNVERNGERIWSSAIGLNAMVKASKDWVPVLMVAQPDLELLEDDVLRVYVWCSPGNAVYLDDMLFRMYAVDRPL